MIYTILLAVSEAFLENVKSGWDAAKDRAVQRGAYISRTPFGYQRRDNRTLEPDADDAPVVAEAFRLAAGGDLHAAILYLQRAAPAGRWTTTTVRRLLGGRVYLGDTRYGEKLAAGTHEALVSRSVWEAAQTSPSRRQPSDIFPLTGIARCSTCHHGIVGSRGGKGQRTYRCSHRGECPQGAVITAERLEDWLRDVTRQMLEGLSATVSDPGFDALTLLERRLADAEAELDAFAADVTLRRALGDRYHQHLQVRVDAVAQARDEYRGRARQSESRLALDEPTIVEDPELFPVVLRSIFASILVKPGRGSVESRVVLVPLDGDEPAGVPGS